MPAENSTNIFKIRFFNTVNKNCILNFALLANLCFVIFLTLSNKVNAQIINANRSGFTWISTEKVTDNNFGAGYSIYCAAWPILKEYPGPSFQTGLGSTWLSTQRTGNEPEKFYTTIEGGLGWWTNTRFGTKYPKFLMGGVSLNFFAWSNGPGVGSSKLVGNGQRDWSTPGGKYAVAQLSNRLLWAPDGLNMTQGLNGELLGYGYTPLPLTEPLEQTAGKNIKTGNQCWTLFLNSTNFKGPATFFLPTYWTKPILENPELEGLFLDTRPSNPNVGPGIEQAIFPAIISRDNTGTPYAKLKRLQFPVSSEKNAIVMNRITAYSKDALWNDMESWFNGGNVVQPGMNQTGVFNVAFKNNGGSMAGEISESGQNGLKHPIDLNYIDNIQQDAYTMGFEFNLDAVDKNENNFILPEYFKLDSDNKWRPINASNVPSSTNLITTDVPTKPRGELTFLTPIEADCQWQDPNGPWRKPGPSAGPFKANLGDGSTVTYYWYRFIDQPAIVHANFPESMRAIMQERIELIHENWKHTDEYIAPPSIGTLATIDPKVIVKPPTGLEIGYVPIVTRQEKTPRKVRVFILAGQSNMQGHGAVVDPENDPGDLVDVIQKDTNGDWSAIGQPGNWTVLDNAFIYFESKETLIKDKVTVGQGARSIFIGPELMFAHQLDNYYEDPILIIKTAWGGKSLAVDFRPPSAGGTTGPYYNEMIKIVNNVTQNLSTEFPSIGTSDFEISGFAWFQGWNDGENDEFKNEYESNLSHLINDVRTDLNIPDLPIIVANSGHGGNITSNDGWVRGLQEVISVAQETVACDDVKYGGHVGFVDTKPFYIDKSESPYNGIHHFHNNALSYLNIGNEIGIEMISAINEMAFCQKDCGEGQQVAPGIVSVGNRVWNDLNRNGINEPNEPGIPGVSVALWSDPDGDGIPDWKGFSGVQVTDDKGYYKFSGLQPGNYTVFVWSVKNWEVGEPLHGFVSSNGFISNANNDIDLDNNGSGNPFTDIKSGIITLTSEGEPLGDGDPFDCFFNYDSSGNNTIDFGFYNSALSIEDVTLKDIQIYPNPVTNELIIKNNLGLSKIKILDILGRTHLTVQPTKTTEKIIFSSLPNGVYFIKFIDEMNNSFKVQKIIKQ